MPSTMSAGESLSRASVSGLIASVGRDCHFERTGIPVRNLWKDRAYYHTGAVTDAPVTYDTSDISVTAYLDHLRVERRLSAHTIDSYGSDLAALVRFARASGRGVESLDRHALEAFARDERSRGLSPRSVARSVAAIRGFYRFLVL